MDVPDQPGDALSQPTRAWLFPLLGQLRRPAPSDELAGRLELHPNGVRTHLEHLHAAGRVLRERERLARGRPRDIWAVDPSARLGGDPPTGYAELARWLVRSLAAGSTRVRDVEATGREIGRELAPTDTGAAPERRMRDVLASLGFQPERVPADTDRVTYRLRNCPYREAVRERQAFVCGLLRGLTRGLLDVIDPATQRRSRPWWRPSSNMSGASMSVDDEGPTAGMSGRSAAGFAVADLAPHGRVHAPGAVVVPHRRFAATLDAVAPRRFAVDRGAVTGVGTQALSLLCGTSRRLGGRSATVTARADLGIHRVLNAHRIDRVVRQPSGQANRPERAPASGRIA